MRRTDRLFDLILILRDGKLHRAQDMADRLEVSVRTIYRDMDTLVASGTPVLGERGVGYMLTSPITLPPINLSMIELEALHLGVAILTEAADPQLQTAAKSLAAKIDAVLPENRVAPQAGWGFAVYPFADAAAGFRHMPDIRSAIRGKNKLDLRYENLAGDITTRVVRPLQLEYWGRVWTCSVWCELRQDFRIFRVDRIQELAVLQAVFVDEPGKSLLDFISAMNA